MKFSPKETEINGNPYQYFDEGDGEITVVLLHGFAQSKSCMKDIAESVVRVGFRCLCLDLPGHHGIPMKYFDGDLAVARYIKDFVDGMGLNGHILVGFSIGGAISLKYAEVYRDDRSLLGVVSWAWPVLGFSSGLSTTDLAVRIMPDDAYSEIWKRALTKKTWQLSYNGHVEDPSKISREDAEKIIQTVRDSKPILKNRIRKFFVFGTMDPAVPEDNYEYVNLRDFETVLVKRGGHFPSEEGRGEAISEIVKFLEDVKKRSLPVIK